MSDTTEHVRQRTRRFAEEKCTEYSATYFRLSHSVAQDDYLPKFIARMPDRQPNLLFASVQYPTGPEEMPMSGSELSSFLRKHESEVAKLMRSRQTQTNEVGRCAVLLPTMPAAPLALVEIGEVVPEYERRTEEVPKSTPVGAVVRFTPRRRTRIQKGGDAWASIR